MWNCTFRNLFSNWPFRKSELHLKLQKRFNLKKREVSHVWGIRGKSKESISLWRNFFIFPVIFLHSLLAKVFLGRKREVTYKPLFRPQELVHHVYSKRQKLEGKIVLYTTVKARLRFCRETLILVWSSSSVSMSFAFMELPALPTKAIWTEDWKWNEVSSSHPPWVTQC